MALALYRKYRPKKLSELVGQDHIVPVLEAAVMSGKISHAYLFTGPRGVGKTSVARILAHALNNVAYDENVTQLDIIEIDAASNRRIDDIRDLREKIHIAPSSSLYKVYIIDEVHMLTSESFNALLKTLEEPPAHAIFILATTEAHKLPATIVSRTQRFHFRSIDSADLTSHLRTIAKKETIAIDNDALALIAKHGQGSFRDSIGLLDQLSTLAGGAVITPELIETTLGLVPSDTIDALVADTLSGRHKQIINALEKLDQAGVAATTTVQQMIERLQAGGDLPQHIRLIDALLDVPRAYNPAVKLLVALCSFAPKQQTKQAALEAAPAEVKQSVASLRKANATTDIGLPVVPVASQVPAASTDSPTSFDWQAVLVEVQASSPALYSILKQAHAHFDKGTLHVYVNYSLHQQKLTSSRYKTLLSGIITKLGGSCPEIVISKGKPMNSTAASVAAIMGGGEPVDVS